MNLASVTTSIVGPFAKLFGWLLAAFYSVSGNYGIAIVLLTLVTMVVVFPLTRKGTRSMMQMQLLQPELLKLRNKYKKKPGMTPEERREITQKQQEEMMALYRENGVSPTGGCLPMFLQFPVFIVLYNTIRGMTRTMTVGKGAAAHVVSDPEFINKHTRLFQALTHDGGRMDAFGLNLADSVRTHQTHWTSVIPYIVVILVAVGLQYVSIWQITNRNPTAGANQQMQQIQKFMPLIFVFIYIEFPAGVGLYFIVSSLFRIGQQEWMYKRDPHIIESVRKLREMKAKNPVPATPPPKGFKQWMAALAPQNNASLTPSDEASGASARTGRKPQAGGGTRPSTRPGSRPAQNGRPRPQGARPVSGTRPTPGSKPSQGARPSEAAGKPGQGSRPTQGSRPGQSTRPPQGGRPPQGKPRPARPPGSRPPGSGARPTSAEGNARAADAAGKPARPAPSSREGQDRPRRPAQSGPSASSGRPASQAKAAGAGGDGGSRTNPPRRRPATTANGNGSAPKRTAPSGNGSSGTGSSPEAERASFWRRGRPR